MAYNILDNTELTVDNIVIGYITSFSPSDNESVNVVTTNSGDVIKSAPTTSTEITVDREGVATTPEDDIALLKLIKKGTFEKGSFAAVKNYDRGRKARYIYTLGSGTISKAITYSATDNLNETYTIRPTYYTENIDIIK